MTVATLLTRTTLRICFSSMFALIISFSASALRPTFWLVQGGAMGAVMGTMFRMDPNQLNQAAAQTGQNAGEASDSCAMTMYTNAPIYSYWHLWDVPILFTLSCRYAEQHASTNGWAVDASPQLCSDDRRSCWDCHRRQKNKEER